MGMAIKCGKCGSFEEGCGYSVRIYSGYMKAKPGAGGIQEKLYKRVGGTDCLCSSCAQEVADMLGTALSHDDVPTSVEED